MYIISSITFLGMPSQFLNSGKIGTFLFTDGHSGWWSLLLITLSFLLRFHKKILKVNIIKLFFLVDIYINRFFDVVCLNKLLQWPCLLPQLSSMRCVTWGWCLKLIDIFTAFENLFYMYNQMHVSTKSVCFLFVVFT